ncbi:MAG: hypothetical protein RL661_855 [Pseudomonadota bacterium]
MMEFKDITEESRRQLDQALTHSLNLKPADFESHTTEAITELPEEFTLPLRHLLSLHKELSCATTAEAARAGEFCFACGAMHEKLQALTLARMEIENAIIGLDSVSARPLAQAQSDQLSRFIAARDRLFRKVADLTLKILLAGLGLLFLGLFFGIV